MTMVRRIVNGSIAVAVGLVASAFLAQPAQAQDRGSVRNETGAAIGTADFGGGNDRCYVWNVGRTWACVMHAVENNRTRGDEDGFTIHWANYDVRLSNGTLIRNRPAGHWTKFSSAEKVKCDRGTGGTPYCAIRY